MKKHFLTILLIVAALVAGAFFPGPDATVQATGTAETALQQPVAAPQANGAAFFTNPAAQIVVGSITLLFAILACVPQLLQENTARDVDLQVEQRLER